MSGWLLASLQVMSGFFALVAIQHLSISLYEGRDRVHGLLGLVALATASIALFRLLGHSAETAESLVRFRQGEIISISLFCVFLLWFTAEYTAYKRRNLLILLSAGWGLFIAVNILRPYGLVFSDLPELSSLRLVSGSHLLDLRLPADNLWNIALRAYVLGALAYCGFASMRIKSLRNSHRARVLFGTTALMAALCTLDLLVDLKLSDFTLASDFSFFPLSAIISLSLLKEANSERQRMTTILNFLPVGLAINDSHDATVFSNKAFKHFFQADPQESEQQSGTGTASGQPSENIATVQAKIMKQSQQSRAELEWPVNGGTLTFEVTLLPLIKEKNSLDETLVIFNNASDRLRKNKDIEKLKKKATLLKRQATSSALAKSLAHEIRQPLAAILNNAQAGLHFIENHDYDINEIKNIFEDIVLDVKRAGEVINSLRTILSKNNRKFEFLKLSNILGTVVRILNSDLVLNTVTVEIEEEKAEEKALWVKGNETQLQQVLINIIGNSLDAMSEIVPNLRKLKLQTYQSKNQAIIFISDTGKGISSDKIDQIFDGFYTTKAQGLGIGLEVCRAIMESHGGKIWAQKNDDCGTNFYISIPISSPSPDTKR